MSGAGAMRVLARLDQVIEAETPYGGRSVAYEPVGTVWLECGARRRSERREADLPARVVETLTARCRLDPRVSEGRVLRFGGAAWIVRGVDATGPAPCRLDLERAP